VRFLVASLLFFAAPLAFADAGLPMLAVIWPLSAFAIVPIVLIESWVVRALLSIEWRTSLVQMTKANLISTLAGIPITWVALVALEMGAAALTTNFTTSDSYPPLAAGDIGNVLLSAPWLGPFTGGGYWKVPVATMALLVPFFFVSGWLEALLVRRALPGIPASAVRGAVWKANLASYSFLLLACIVWLVYGMLNHA
jgi:hypothetical protein